MMRLILYLIDSFNHIPPISPPTHIQIAPSSYYEHKARVRNPDRPPDRMKRDNLSIRYTERLIEADIDASAGCVVDSYDNALAETININGLFKTEVIWHCGPWRNIDEVEFATLEWVDWFSNLRLLEPIGNIPPAEFEMAYYRQLRE